ncbi:M3 family oligoendopeptidase [Lacticaseibacillus paracasei]|uniref:M3 family oligoendopeptidase n=1 Tax=Lacticaseibacillus paracasei TaxID=1597 RepID=UPI000D707F9C|nr:M3 family oligoendopeptidase [Lacticaseibacillus paracasei]AWN83410.1 oligoendopeptidase [Lacticaseibacillus paracasei]
MSYPINWNLDSIFPGGIDSPQLADRISDVTAKLPQLESKVAAWIPDHDAPEFTDFITLWQLLEDIGKGLATTSSFVEMIASADTANLKTGPVQGQLTTLYTRFQNINNPLAKKLAAMSQAAFDQLTTTSALSASRFGLQEMRDQAKELLDDQTETMINDLAVDGFTGWSDHYTTLSGSLKFPITQDGKTTELSAGQTQNKFEGDPDTKTREQVFNVWEQTWDDHASLFGETLNHIAGFRLTNYRLHHYPDYLFKPLQYNRMQRATLDQMWHTISANKQPFAAYLTRKAELTGKPTMPWYDHWAPVIVGDFQPKTYTFDEAAEFIVNNFAKFSPKMAAFAKQAFENGWIEAEDRPGKRAGGYMTSVPDVKESRIFMTFDGSASGVSTIAHELGHAFHSSILKDMPLLRQDYAMNVAETASTFAELIVADATVKAATSPAEKLNLLDAKMANPLAMLLNIHARFLFEDSFYQEREKGIVSVPRLKELMTTAQQQAYAGGLSSFDPMYWADKLHFYFDNPPFYNFPYTFGYLFSSGIYAKAQASDNFEDDYIALLRDTANMTTEALAKKHLGVDLTQPDFWQQGIDLAAKDAQQFMTLSEGYLK